MDLQGWIRDSVKRIYSDRWDGVVESSRPIYRKGLHQLSRFQSGRTIYRKEWSLLVVLDACRVDLIEQVSDNDKFIDTIGRFESLDTMILWWMKKNFTPEYSEEMSKTAYICGNPFSEEELNGSDFADLDEVWRYTWDEDLGTLPPRPVTDRAVQMGRENDHDRLIVHYMQPHCPFLPNLDLSKGKRVEDFGDQEWDDVWARLRKGEITRDAVWDAYRGNLKRVLDDVGVLLRNIDAERTVITSDHGNAVGEWGVYGHPVHMPLSCLRIVPWIEVSARDTRGYTPSRINREDDDNVSDRLESLGYM